MTDKALKDMNGKIDNRNVNNVQEQNGPCAPCSRPSEGNILVLEDNDSSIIETLKIYAMDIEKIEEKIVGKDN